MVYISSSKYIEVIKAKKACYFLAGTYAKYCQLVGKR